MIQRIMERRVDLAKVPSCPAFEDICLFRGDAYPFVWRCEVTNGGAAVELTGGAVDAWAVRADGVSVLMPGTVSGNVITVEVPPAALSVAGQTVFILRYTRGDTHITLDSFVTSVLPSESAAIADPDEILPDAAALMEIASRYEAYIPTGGTAGQVLTRTSNGAAWRGAVNSVNGYTGAVEMRAEDVGAKPARPWELIAMTLTEEAVHAISVTTDMDDDALALAECRLLLIVPAGVGTSHVSVTVNGRPIMAFAAGVSDQIRYMAAEIEADGGLMSARATGCAGSYHQLSSQTVPVMPANSLIAGIDTVTFGVSDSDMKINGIVLSCVSSSVDFPAGTRVCLYGREEE